MSNVGSFINGDTLVVAPTISTKIYEGSGSANIGDFQLHSNLFSITATVDSDLVDTGSTKNRNLKKWDFEKSNSRAYEKGLPLIEQPAPIIFTGFIGMIVDIAQYYSHRCPVLLYHVKEDILHFDLLIHIHSLGAAVYTHFRS